MLNSNDMIKKIKPVILIASLLFFAGCDKDFEKINTNPYSITSIDPALLFAGAQRTHIGTWYGEHTIVQQFVSPYNTGANLGFNFNEDIDGNSTPKWDQSYAGGANGNASSDSALVATQNSILTVLSQFGLIAAPVATP